MFFFDINSKFQSFMEKKMIDYEYESLIFYEYTDNRTINIYECVVRLNTRVVDNTKIKRKYYNFTLNNNTI